MDKLPRYLKSTALFLLTAYVALAGLSYAVYHAPWALLRHLPEAARDQLISSGVVRAEAHPLYREWLLNFVRTPDAPRDTNYAMDTYQAYGEIFRTVVDDEDSDSMGWPNAITPREASVLFVGDSFTNGASAGTRLSPPAQYAAITGAKAYNASNGGYGLGQYVRIIDKLTRGLPEDTRFAGKDVVVLVYLGNDLTSDLVLYSLRQSYTGSALSWQLELGPLRAWTRYLLASYGLRPAFAAPTPTKIPSGRYSPVPMACATQGGLPFAWHPGYAGYLTPENFTGLLPLAASLIGELKTLKDRGLNIRVVLVPSSLQVLDRDLDTARLAPDGPMAAELPRIAQALEEVRALSLKLFGGAGFEVLDVTPAMKASPDRCLFYQPGDTHCTAQGYRFIAEAIAARWPRLGR